MGVVTMPTHSTDVTPDNRVSVEASRGPARVAAAAATRFGDPTPSPAGKTRR